MLPVNLSAYTRESGTTIISKLEMAILSNGCFIVDFTSFSPTETGLTIEGDPVAILNTLTALGGLGTTFTDNPEFEMKNIRNSKEDVTIMIFLVTGKKMNVGNWLDERFKGDEN